jgi:CrcB protein
MIDAAIVGLGGALGAMGRYGLGSWILHHTPQWRFPIGTCVVNLLGCLVAGILWGIAERTQLFTQDVRLFLFTGVLGGFTTFSAFGLETVTLLRRNEAGIAAAYVGLSVVCGVAAVWLGLAVVMRVLR